MQGKKVLIVDDLQSDLINLKSIISQKCSNVLTAASGKESVEIAKKENPDLIFMDIVMEEMDGYNACREIKENPDTKNIPIVFVSSKDQKADLLWAKKQGGATIVTKPYTENQIFEQMNLYL